MTDTTYKWGEAPGEFKSQKDAQRAKTKQKVKSRRLRKSYSRNNEHSQIARASDAMKRTFKPGTVKKWGNIVKSIATQLRSVGSPVPRGSGGGKTHPWKTEIPKKLTRNY